MRILVMEDCRTAAQITCGKLFRLGFDAFAAPTMTQVAERLNQPGIDAILMDISRSDCIGLDSFDQLQALDTSLPIVVFSVHDDHAVALEFVRKGAQDYLIKGVTGDKSLGRCLEYAIERNRVRQAQRSAEECTRSVLEKSYDAFITMDSDWHITEWNGLAEKTFGWKRQEMVGQSFSRIIPHHLQKQFLSNIKTYFGKREGSFFKTSREIVVEHRSGKTFPVEIGIFKIDKDGESLFSAVVRDISKAKKSNEELELLVHERTEKLSQSNLELRQFAKIASHDLQEPLRAVQGFANLLAEGTKGQLDKDCTEFLEFILDGTERMKHLIQSILVHSQLNAAASINQATDCNSVVQEVVNDLRASIDETDTSLEIDILPEVAVERSQMVQLFQNLISNAIKYRSASPPLIDISSERSGHQWLFSVRDNSIGIEPQYADRIFDMFARLHSKGKYLGTGIGLAICKRIVTSHGGNIWVESKLGQGCIFMFTLPEVNQGSKTKMKDWIEILLVEDTPSDVRLTQEALKRSVLNYHMTVAGDGVEAMEHLNKLKQDGGALPDIILLDLNMPRKNGHEVLEEIKNDPILRPIPVVLLTVSERDEDVLEALSTKMNYYVAKPVTSDKLSTLVKAIHELQTEEEDDDAAHTLAETHIRLVLAGNPHTSVIALAKLADDPNERVRCRVAENSRLTTELQMKLANDPKPEVRASLCDNPNLTKFVLEILAKDASEDVRLAASTSPNISALLLGELAHDENVYVSARAHKTLAELKR